MPLLPDPAAAATTTAAAVAAAGGYAVLKAVQAGMPLPASKVLPSFAALRDYGNTSCSTTWYVMAYMETVGAVAKGQQIMQVGARVLMLPACCQHNGCAHIIAECSACNTVQFLQTVPEGAVAISAFKHGRQWYTLLQPTTEPLKPQFTLPAVAPPSPTSTDRHGWWHEGGHQRVACPEAYQGPAPRLGAPCLSTTH